MGSYRVVLVDEYDISRAGMRLLVEELPQVRVVAEAKNAEGLMALLAKVAVDLVMMNLPLPNTRDVDLAHRIRRCHPWVRLLVLTLYPLSSPMNEAFTASANGLLGQGHSAKDLRAAIRQVLFGPPFAMVSGPAPPATGNPTDADVEVDDIGQLTRREIEVLQMVADGLPNRKIAGRLNISIRTVENHRCNLKRKTGARSTAGLVHLALRSGLCAPC